MSLRPGDAARGSFARRSIFSSPNHGRCGREWELSGVPDDDSNGPNDGLPRRLDRRILGLLLPTRADNW